MINSQNEKPTLCNRGLSAAGQKLFIPFNTKTDNKKNILLLFKKYFILQLNY
jgi:hypothetical protein